MKLVIIASFLIASCVGAHNVVYETDNSVYETDHGIQERDAGYGAPEPVYGAPSGSHGGSYGAPSYGGHGGNTGFGRGNEVDANTAVSYYTLLD